ncbi:Helicase ARIP4 [Hordeum vulgare]|nr:Helicase ARIP4 [Hordeum vulgare]
MWYAPRHLLRRGNAIVRVGLHHDVGLFLAYFEHRRRASNQPPPPLFFGVAAARSPESHRPSTSFIFVQHQVIASVVVVFPGRFIYSDHRGQHRPPPICAATVVESFSASLPDMVYRMDPSGCKRQKHEAGHGSSPGTQSLSSIIRSVRLRLLDELKYGSVTEDFKAINRKRHELISTLEKLRQVPIKLPCASAALETSDASLHGAAQSGKNVSSDRIIDLDQYDVGDHTHGNMDNIGTQKTVILLDSDDEDMVKSSGDGNLSGSKQNTYFTQECIPAEQPCHDQDIIMRDDEIINSFFFSKRRHRPGLCIEIINSEAQLVVDPGKYSMGIDDENRVEEEETREGEGEDVQSKGHMENNNISVVDSYEISCKDESLPFATVYDEEYELDLVLAQKILQLLRLLIPRQILSPLAPGRGRQQTLSLRVDGCSRDPLWQPAEVIVKARP